MDVTGGKYRREVFPLIDLPVFFGAKILSGEPDIFEQEIRRPHTETASFNILSFNSGLTVSRGTTSTFLPSLSSRKMERPTKLKRSASSSNYIYRNSQPGRDHFFRDLC